VGKIPPKMREGEPRKRTLKLIFEKKHENIHNNKSVMEATMETERNGERE